MSAAVEIIYRERDYSVYHERFIWLTAGPHRSQEHDEEAARRWLSDHGLKASKARKLLAAAIRSEGELADPNHPLRQAAQKLREPSQSSAQR